MTKDGLRERDVIVEHAGVPGCAWIVLDVNADGISFVRPDGRTTGMYPLHCLATKHRVVR